MHSFLLALQFLTCVPVPSSFVADDRHWGRSVLYYPLIGIIIGLFLLLLAVLTNPFPVVLQSAIILTTWVLLTGGLHLDGLADCADAWVGGLGDKERTLNIMKDPCAGPIAVIAVALTLLLKWSILQTFTISQLPTVLLAAPLLGRTAILAQLVSVPYISKKGLARPLINNLPVGESKLLLTFIILFGIAWLGWMPVLLAGLVVFTVRAMALRRLGGMTGDIYGATVELVELTVLMGLALNDK